MPETFIVNCGCNPAPGTVTPGVTPYVVSLNSLYGIITLAGSGAVDVTSSGNTIYIDLAADAGLGSVTSVALASNNTNLTVVSGSPITTLGTITLGLAGNIGSIAGLVMAADQMLYSTGAATFAATSLTAFGRSLIDDANAAAAQTTLALVIGTNVQAWSADLDSFVSAASWPAGVLTLTSGVTLTGATGLTLTNADINGVSANFTDNVTIGDTLTVTNSVTAGTFSGNGAALTALNGTQVTTGTVDETVGGTGNTTYVAGDLLQGTSANVLSKLASVAAGSFLRSGGVTTASAWSTLVLPNAATVGDIFSSSTTNTMSRITAVATGNALISGGVATIPSWGKITTAHTTGIAASGANGDITSLSALTSVSSNPQFSGDITLLGILYDSTAFEGDAGAILSSTGTGTQWTLQPSVQTLELTTNFALNGTIIAGGDTGDQTINKPCGTIRIAAAGSSVIITNSLATTSHRCLTTVCSNDTTAKSASATVATGAITVRTNAACTAETEIYWELREIT